MSSKLSVTRTVVLSAATLLAAPAVHSQLLVRVGLEFQVNAYTTGNQSAPAVASNGPGFVLVWSSDRDGSSLGIFGQRFSSGGTQAGEFQINTYTEGDQNNPRVAADSVGNFVVIWQSTGQDGDNAGIFGHRFDSSGAPLGGEFQVNSFTVGYQGAMHVAADADGDFVVVWTSYAQDNPSTGPSAAASPRPGFRKPPSSRSTLRRPPVSTRVTSAFRAMATSSSLGRASSWAAVAWDLRSSVRQRGAPQGEFQVNTYTTASQYDSRIAVAADGDFVIAWVSPGQDGDFKGVFGRGFASGGNALGGEFRINSRPPTSG